LALMVLAGCAQPGGNAAGDATVPITTLASQGQCGELNRPTVRWIANSGEWRELYARMNSQWMNPPPPPAVDFSHEGVLLIAMGQRSTAGYGLALADDTATVRGGGGRRGGSFGLGQCRVGGVGQGEQDAGAEQRLRAWRHTVKPHYFGQPRPPVATGAKNNENRSYL
jgi:hypothetical protein